jgi:hypothetical protein
VWQAASNGCAVWADSCDDPAVAVVNDMCDMADLDELAHQAKIFIDSQWAAARIAAVQAEESTPSGSA